jgi:hypothetical protein
MPVMAGKRLIARPMPSALAMAVVLHLFGRKRHVTRPFALEIAPRDFVVAGHLHSPIGLCLSGWILRSLAVGVIHCLPKCFRRAASVRKSRPRESVAST